MKPEELTEVARWLADDSKTGKSKHAYRRRSLSTAYYALFHALTLLCADEISQGADSLEREHVYRALDHATARTALQALARESKNSDLAAIAAVFSDLQALRHEADYSEAMRLTAHEAMKWRDTAAEAIWQVGKLSPPVRRTLAIRLLFKTRPNRR